MDFRFGTPPTLEVHHPTHAMIQPSLIPAHPARAGAGHAGSVSPTEPLSRPGPESRPGRRAPPGLIFFLSYSNMRRPADRGPAELRPSGSLPGFVTHCR
eukprot:767096-Hanusia_phi.AAC.5